jgi:hypothetical protein
MALCLPSLSVGDEGDDVAVIFSILGRSTFARRKGRFIAIAALAIVPAFVVAGLGIVLNQGVEGLSVALHAARRVIDQRQILVERVA